VFHKHGLEELSQEAYGQIPAGSPLVPAAISSIVDLVEAFQDEDFSEISRRFEIMNEVITLGVYIGCDVVSDLPGRVAEADSFVKGRGACPERPALPIHFLRTPKSNVMAFPRVITGGLLKGQILLASPQIKVADRSIIVRAPENRGPGDSQATAQTKRVSGVPLGCQHDSNDLLVRADQGHVERIARDVASRACRSGNVIECGVPALVPLPDCRYKHIRQYQVHEHQDGN
jgi:hypothetical protein